MARFSIHYTSIAGSKPFWFDLDAFSDREKAIREARNYALNHGGYVCVKDSSGAVIYGTDPAGLDRSVASGLNRHFTPHPETAVSP